MGRQINSTNIILAVIAIMLHPTTTLADGVVSTKGQSQLYRRKAHASSASSDERKAYPKSASSDERKRDAYKRGDVDDCSLSYDDESEYKNQPLPCRHSRFPGNPDLPTNLLTEEVYVGLPPARKTVAPTLTIILSREWDASLPNMDFMVQSSYNKFFDSESDSEDSSRRGVRGRDNERSGGTSHDSGVEEEQFVSDGDKRELVVVQGNRGKSLRYLIESNTDTEPIDSDTDTEPRQLQRAKVFDMHHTQTVSELLTKHYLRWWWRISITYECVWGDNDDPVGLAVMNEISANMTTELEVFSPEVLQSLQTHHRDGLIRLRTEEEGIPPETEDDADDEDQLIQQPPTMPTPSPTDGNDDEIVDMVTAPLDAQEWDWRKYLGLCIVVFTLTTVLILVILGAKRKKRKEQKENWANLATEDGVEKLLTTGWTLKDSQMQIYDKEKLGYLEDDSIFLGGFEQVSPVVGAEITITHSESETNTRDVAGLPTIADTNSQKPSTFMSES